MVTEPDWLKDGQRGPGITDDFRHIPLVTMWQMAFDLASAGSVPVGWGHMYSPEANAASWVAVTQPDECPTRTPRTSRSSSPSAPTGDPAQAIRLPVPPLAVRT